jgi:putative flippase GtrA
VVTRLKRFANWVTSLGGYATPPVVRLIRFTVSGLTCFTFDMLMLRWLTETMGVHYLVSAALAFLVAVSCHYLINRRWAFKGTERALVHGYAYFVTFAVINMSLMVASLSLLVEVFHVPYLSGRIGIAGALGIINFIANSTITFKVSLFRH